MKSVIISKRESDGIRNGSITMLYKVLKDQSRSIMPLVNSVNNKNKKYIEEIKRNGKTVRHLKTLPFCKGEYIFCKEDYAVLPVNKAGKENGRKNYFFDAADIPDGYEKKLLSATTMPSSAARIYLRVENVSIVKIDTISHTDLNKMGFSGAVEFKKEYEERLKEDDKKNLSFDRNPYIFLISIEESSRKDAENAKLPYEEIASKSYICDICGKEIKKGESCTVYPVIRTKDKPVVFHLHRDCQNAVEKIEAAVPKCCIGKGAVHHMKDVRRIMKHIAKKNICSTCDSDCEACNIEKLMVETLKTHNITEVNLNKHSYGKLAKDDF